MANKNDKWIRIDAEKIDETDRAVLLQFNNSVSGFNSHDKDVWIPKSCYLESVQGLYNIQEVKEWIYFSKDLYRLMK